MVEAGHKCLQQMHLLALHLEMVGCIRRLLDLVNLRKIGDFSRESLISRLLRTKLASVAPLRLTDVAENNFSGEILSEGSMVRKLRVERGIRTEDEECSRRGDTTILSCFLVLMISVCKGRYRQERSNTHTGH